MEPIEEMTTMSDAFEQEQAEVDGERDAALAAIFGQVEGEAEAEAEAGAEAEAEAEAAPEPEVEPVAEVTPLHEDAAADLVSARDLDGYEGPTYSLVSADGTVLDTYRADVPFGFELAEGQSVVRND